ncbi:MAG: TrmH family RNA methyltransferase [Longimicrobiales bacterium]|nr:TrmH family RNA methyltransferase [Longimicrobiales bacterium]
MADPTLTERYRAARSDPELAVLEGFHALKHALRFDAEVLDVRTRDPVQLRSLAEALAPDVADELLERANTVPAGTFDSLAPAPHPTGVIALARRRVPDVASVLGIGGSAGRRPADAGAGTAAPVVLLERATHHGNIGAVVRVAAAAGAAGVLVTGAHDPWHPASIRGAAGLQYALPVASLESGAAAALATDRPVVVLDPEGEPLVAGDGSRPAIPPESVLAFGSERTGISEALRERADLRVAIPMRPGVSSLNLATAVAVTLYAAGGWAAFRS